jgi:hypothetical protein
MGTMKVYRSLEICGNAEALKTTLDGVRAAVSGTWRVVPVEQALSGPPLYGFVCERTQEHSAATLWLVKRSGRLALSNIVPNQGERRLSADEYNCIAAEFCGRFVHPVAQQTQVEVILSDTEVAIEKWVSAETAQLLRRFSDAANKSTGSSHPLDEERWFEFVAAAHRERADLDGGTLMQWLLDDEGWPEDVAAELAEEYEKLISFLNFCDKTAWPPVHTSASATPVG